MKLKGKLGFILVILVVVFLGIVVYRNNKVEDSQSAVPKPTKHFRVLVFTKTAGFRHDSIPEGLRAIKKLGKQNDFSVDATQSASDFNENTLAKYDTVIWLLTSGNVLNSKQQEAFKNYIKKSNGYVGIHSAADTEYDWPWYGGLVGAYFKTHPRPQKAILKVEDTKHDSTAHISKSLSRFDEWYNYQANPRQDVHVLLSLNEKSYKGGSMGNDHPISWCHDYGGGRAWYTGMGHTKESYSESDFLKHILGGIRTTAGITDSDCSV